ncbi:MAG: acetyl-CoA acetyltransferase, partial [Myxococcota bacterium]
MTSISILGGYQSDFARNFRKEGGDISGLVAELVEQTLAQCQVAPEEIDTIHVGNAFGQAYTGQGHLGAMPATVVPALWGVPAMRHEAACASGSLATLTAMAELEAGRYDCALVLGAELEKTMPGAEAAQVQVAAAWVEQEAETEGPIWPAMFERIAEAYDRRYGLDEQYLRAIGELNLTNAKTNPNAQTRGWKLDERSFAKDDEANPIVSGRLRRNDICQLTDGGAGIVLVSDRWLAAHSGVRPKARITGWGHQTVGLPLDQKLDRKSDSPFLMPHVRNTIEDAFKRAGLNGVEDLDLIETHDCMTPSEYMAIDH